VLSFVFVVDFIFHLAIIYQVSFKDLLVIIFCDSIVY